MTRSTVSSAAARLARLQTLQKIEKPRGLPGAIPLGLGERLENATIRELPNGLVDSGFGSPRQGCGDRCSDDGMRGENARDVD